MRTDDAVRTGRDRGVDHVNDTPDRRSYTGPIEVGMVMVGLGSEGEPFRRDLVLGFHPFKEGMVIFEALPCKMRARLGSGVGEIGLCPLVNMRYVMNPEEPVPGVAEDIIGRTDEGSSMRYPGLAALERCYDAGSAETTSDERLETMRLYVAAAQPEPSKALLDWMREVELQLAALRTVALENAVIGNGHVRRREIR